MHGNELRCANERSEAVWRRAMEGGQQMSLDTTTIDLRMIRGLRYIDGE